MHSRKSCVSREKTEAPAEPEAAEVLAEPEDSTAIDEVRKEALVVADRHE